MDKLEQVIQYFEKIKMKQAVLAMLADSRRSPSGTPYPPEKMKKYCRVSHRIYNHRPVFVLSPENPTARMIYLHGGAYYNEFDPAHWALMGRFVRELNVEVVAPDYPLTPVFGHKDVFDMVTRVYRDCLVDLPEGGLLMAGDSAGGGIALALTQWALQEGVPLPRRLALLSPWLDVTMSDPEIKELDKVDPFLEPGSVGQIAEWYCQGEDPRFYQISPLFGPVKGLPPTLVMSGTRDILYSDAKRFVKRLEEEQVPHKFHRGEGMIHTWMLFPIEERREALADLMQFLAER